MSEPEQRMFAVDSILKALGIEDKEDLDELIALFYAYKSVVSGIQQI